MDRNPSFATSGVTAGATILNENGRAWAVQVNTDGTNAADVKLFDGPVGNNKLLAHISCSGADRFRFMELHGVHFTASLQIVVTGTGAEAGVYYSK